MDQITQLLNALLLVAMTIVITWYMSGKFRSIEKRFDANDEAHAAMATRDHLAALQQIVVEQGREIAALRSDLTHVALAVGARTRPATG